MVQVNQCCCCVELEAGCKVLAILGIVGSSISLAKCFFYFDALPFIIYVVALISNLLLLHGAIKRNPSSVKMYLVIHAFFITLTLVGMAVAPFLFEEKPEAGAIVLLVSIYVLAAGLGIYFWIVAYSYYKKISCGPAMASA